MDDPRSFFPAPPPLADLDVRAARSRGLSYEQWSFDSEYEPHPGEPGRDRWLAYHSNRRAQVWVLQHREPRPWLVGIHGAKMGKPVVDLTLFRARWLHEELGLNVALPVLPLHGERRRAVPPATDFPGENVLDNVHGFAQAVWDVRRLLSSIRAQASRSASAVCHSAATSAP
jgi:hypothetical protein